MFALARCGKAFVAWPAESMVATQVVRSMACQFLSLSSTATEPASSGLRTTAAMAAPASPPTIFDMPVKYARFALVQLNGKFVTAHAIDGPNDVINRVIRHRPRAMAFRDSSSLARSFEKSFRPRELRSMTRRPCASRSTVGALRSGQARHLSLRARALQPACAIQRAIGFFTAGQR